MTKEEARKMLISKMDGNTDTSYEWAETVRMAIKALEQQPSDDCVSRAEVKQFVEYIQSIKDSHNAEGTPINYGTICDLVIRGWKLMELPPVTPTQRWIPVSEKLPEEETDVLICNANKEIAISRGSYSTEIENTFIWYTSGWRFGEVIAWQPLPKAYEEKRNNKPKTYIDCQKCENFRNSDYSKCIRCEERGSENEI